MNIITSMENKMLTKEFNDLEINVDEYGFLLYPEDWNERIALNLAYKEKIKVLTEKHWIIIRFIRDFYINNGHPPTIMKICRELEISLMKIYELFPSGPSKGACKIAGVTKPIGCI